MSNYNLEHLKYLVENIKSDYGFIDEKLHDQLYQFMDESDGIVMRLCYLEEPKQVIVSFNVALNPTIAITLYNYLQEKLPKIILSVEFYQDKFGESHIGQDAHAAYQLEVEDTILDFHKFQSTETYDPDDEFPVSFVSQKQIFAAWDQYAWDEYKLFKNQKQNMIF